MIKTLLNDFTENTYIINEKKDAFIVDPGAKLIDIIKHIKEKELNVVGVLLTHGHFDHILTINEIVDEYNPTIYIHEKERDFLFDPNLNLSGQTYRKFILNNKKNVTTLKHGDVIKLGFEQIKVYHTPGHTRGSVCYKYKRVLFSGDTLFKGTIGRTDLPTSSSVDMQRSLKLLIETQKDNTMVYPGHGHFTTIINEKYENPYMKQLIKA